jgi:Transglycosylase SLT domain
MRRLFVPACLCVMTLSNTTGFDLPLEDTPGTSNFENSTLVRPIAAAPAPEPAGASEEPAAVADIPGDAADAAGAAGAPRPVPLPPVAKPVVPRSRAEICHTLAKAAQRNDLPVPFFIRLLFQESRFEPGVVSSAGAQGIAQFMPETAADEGLDNPFDPLQAIPASARLLKKLFEQFGNLGLAAAAYNAGPKTIQDWLAKKGNLPEETQGYVKTVTGHPAETWRAASARATELSLPPRAPCKEAVPAAPTVTAAKAPHVAHEHAKLAHRGKTRTHDLAARAQHKHKNQKLAQR